MFGKGQYEKIVMYIGPLLSDDTVTGMSVKRCLEVSRSFCEKSNCPREERKHHL